MYVAREFVEDWGLMSYGASLPNLRRLVCRQDPQGSQSGRPPADQPTKLKLVFNLKTAEELGLVIPREFLMLADEVFE